MTDLLERMAIAIKNARALPGTKPVARPSDVDRRAARAALAAMKYVDGTDEHLAIAAARPGGVDAVIVIGAVDAYIDAALAEASRRA